MWHFALLLLFQGTDTADHWDERMARAGELYRKGDIPNARRVLSEACADLEALTMPRRAMCKQSDAVVFSMEGNRGEALAAGEQAVAYWRKAIGNGAPPGEFASALTNLGILYRDGNEFSKAEAVLRESVEVNRKVFGDHDPELRVTSSMAQLGLVLGSLEKFRESESVLRQAIAREESQHGEGANLNSIRLMQAAVWMREGRYRAGLELLQRTEANGRLRPPDADYAETLMMLAGAYRVCKQPERGLPLAKRALALFAGDPKTPLPILAAAHRELALAHASNKEWSEAFAQIERAKQAARRAEGSYGMGEALIDTDHAAFLLQKGNPLQAAEILKEALAAMERLAPGSFDTALVRGRWGQALAATGQTGQADQQYHEAAAQLSSAGGSHPETGQLLARYAAFLKQQRRPEAKAVAARALRIQQLTIVH